jgi:ABC-type iron transport system FetAB permease component
VSSGILRLAGRRRAFGFVYLLDEHPLVAIRYQMLVVFMLAAATALGSLLFVRLAAARYFTAAHQLRRFLL